MSQELKTLFDAATDSVEKLETEVKSMWVDGVRFWYGLWSVRMAILSTILGGVSALLPTWQPAMPALPFAILSTLCAALAGVSSLVKQPALLATIQSDRDARAEAAAKAAADAQAERDAAAAQEAQAASLAAEQANREAAARQAEIDKAVAAALAKMGVAPTQPTVVSAEAPVSVAPAAQAGEGTGDAGNS